MTRRILLLVSTLLLASNSPAQTLTVGVDIATPNSSDSAIAPVRTDISLDNPATATGTISTVKFAWSSSGCLAAAKVKFFRRNGNILTMTAERGPFDTAFTSAVTLSPPVPVQAGDLIAIARVANCGNPTSLVGPPSNGYVVFASDVTGSVDISSGFAANAALALFGTGTSTEFTGGILPVVGSVTGSFGSNFKTSVQLFNGAAGSPTLTGRLVFHRAGAAGSGGDPSLSFSVAPGRVVSFSDAVAAIGQTGLGSVDVVIPNGQAMPVIITRIFNDAGANGTAGFTEDAINPATSGIGSRVITTGATAALVTPIDPTRTRFNIGVRSLSGGAQMTVTLKDSNGITLASTSKSYAANWFEQVDSTSFVGMPVGANQSIQIVVTAGSAIVYGATTDNVTNDPSVQFAPVVVTP